MQNAAKRVFTCKDRRRYSRKRVKICQQLATTLRVALAQLFAGRAAAPAGPAPQLAKLHKIIDYQIWQILQLFFAIFAIFWQARSRLYENEILQENMRLTAFFKLYKICILLHRCNLKILAKKSV